VQIEPRNLESFDLVTQEKYRASPARNNIRHQNSLKNDQGVENGRSEDRLQKTKARTG
jgi:hypothetical protein